MTTHEVANALVKFCTEGKLDKAIETLYSPDIVSMEAGAPPGQSREAKGLRRLKPRANSKRRQRSIRSFPDLS